jgi:Zn-dependent metalloprotease
MLALTAALWAVSAGAAFADSAASAAQRLQAAGGQVEFGNNGTPRFIGATEPGARIPLSMPPQARTPEGFARAAMAEYGAVFGITDPDSQLKTRRVAQHGQQSSTHFQQLHNGVPVIGGELVVNVSGDAITSFNGESAPNLTLDTTPSVDAATAGETALAGTAKWHREEASRLTVSEPELSVYVPALIGPGDGKGRLVWRMEVTSTVGGPIREMVLVDAQNGIIALHFNQVDTARNRLTYDANGSSTEIYTAHTLRCDEANDTCVGGDADEVAAHTYAKNTYDFFSTHHGRDSIDGAGMSLISVVHSTAPVCPNAYWNGVQMTYCDGLTADDVVAHELTHGVTEYTSGLYYYYQSGAINESFSDVWGEFVDQSNGLGSDTATDKWLIGEDVPVGYFGGPIRSMKNPATYGDPDKMTSANYYTGSSDNGGVHTNSGVNNKAVYLMTDGGTFNGITVTGIGRNKVAAIYYKVQDDYLTQGADYYDLYLALQQACAALVGGAEGITTANCTQVKNAALAVEMNKQPVTNFRQHNAPLCPSGTPTTVAFSDDFESGYGNWLQTGAIWTSLDFLSNSLYAYASGSSDARAYVVSPITVPAGGYLWFSHFYNFEYFGTDFYDGGVLEYSADRTTWSEIPASLIDAGTTYDGYINLDYGNPLAGRAAFAGFSNGFASTRVNLSKFAGNEVYFRWRFATDTTGASEWLIDDVQVYSCNPADKKAPTVAATLPANAATAVTRNSSVTVRFSEPMNCATVTASRFTLKYGTTPVAGVVTCSGNAATFNPNASLGASKKYTATISSAVTDLAGNRMAANKVWSFTTGTATDTTRPTVPTVSPANGSTGNVTLKTITATFSENLDCTTVKAASVTLLEGAVPLTPNISCSGKTVSIGPMVLKSSTTYTVTLGTAITDLAGNALAVPKSWSFSTAGGMAFAP